MRTIHNIFFMFGAVYYLVIPVIVGHFMLFYDESEMIAWHIDYGKINSYNLAYYLWIVSLLIIAFFTGSILVDRKKQVVVTKKNKEISSSFVITVINLLLLSLLLLFYILNYQNMFLGYQAGYDYLALGQVSTLNMLSTFFFFFFLFQKKKGSEFYLVVLNQFISFVFLISYGSRMYILIPICAVFLYKNKYSPNVWSLKKIFCYTFLIMLFMLAIGLWRHGLSISYKGVILILYAEPIFSWWSSSTYLGRNNIELIAMPLNYISSFINFLPSVFFPDKVNYITALESMADFSSPLGATSIFVSLMVNFGVVFSAVYMFFTGMFYSYVKKLADNHLFFKIYYIMICSILPFQFFRDNFAIINKQIFFNLFILPLICLSINSLAKRPVNEYKNMYR